MAGTTIPFDYQQTNRNSTRQNQNPKVSKCRAQQLEPRTDLVKPGMTIAIDCEGVLLPLEFGDEKNGLGRVSIVDEAGRVIYDTFTYYPKDRQARPNPQWLKLGVKYNDIKPEYGAQPHAEVWRTVKKILDECGVIVGHAISNEIKFLREFSWADYQTRDTQRAQAYAHHNPHGLPKLRTLSENVLGETIQAQDHCSVEDARATMKLYLLHRTAIDLAQATVPAPANPPAAIPSTANLTTVASSASVPSNSTSPWTNSASGNDTSSGHGSEESSVATTIASENVGIAAVRAVRHFGVALPDLPWLGKGKVFDKRTSRYT